MDLVGSDEEKGGVRRESGRVGGGRVVISGFRVTALKLANARRGEFGEAVECRAMSGLLGLLGGGGAGRLWGVD